MKKHLVRLAATSVLFSGLSVVTPANAAVATFGVATGDYATGANWSTTIVPIGADDAWIGNGGTTRAATYNSATNYTTTGRFLIGYLAGSNGSLTIDTGAGTLTFGGNNFSAASYVGVDNGTGTLTMNAGTIDFTGAAGFIVGSNANASNGTVTLNSGSTLNVGSRLGASLNAGGATSVINLDGGTLNIGTGGVNGLGGNQHGVFRFGSGNATVNLNSGTLSLFAFQSDHGVVAPPAINFNGATVQARGSTTQFFTDTGTTGLGNYSANVKNGGAIIDTNGFDITAAASLIQYAGTSTGGLQKQGSGILSLSGANTYIGNTVVNAGTLRLVTAGTNNIANSAEIQLATSTAGLDVSAVTGGFALASLQTLSGIGTVTGNLTSGAGSTVAPGGAGGILTVNGNTALNGAVQIDATGAASGAYDQLQLGSVAGIFNVSIGGTLATNFTGGNWAADSDSLWIVNNNSTGTLTGTFSNFPTNGQSIGIYAGKEWFINYGADFGANALTGGNDVALFAVAIPEPATYGVLILGALGFGLLRTRSVKNDDLPAK